MARPHWRRTSRLFVDGDILSTWTSMPVWTRLNKSIKSRPHWCRSRSRHKENAPWNPGRGILDRVIRFQWLTSRYDACQTNGHATLPYVWLLQRLQNTREYTLLPRYITLWFQHIPAVQRFGVGHMIERSLVRLPAGALSSQWGQLSLPSLRGR